LQLRERLRRINAELAEVKRDLSSRKDSEELLASRLNQSQVKLTGSKLLRQRNENSMGQHLRVLEVLDKLNTEKLRKHQRMAEEMRKKRSAEEMQAKEMEKWCKQEVGVRRHINEAKLQKIIRNSEKIEGRGNRVSSFRLRDFEEAEPDQESSVIMPATIT
jgi:hypothetical protein